jgi:polar amino acid transport system substrate-binding protein
MAIGMRAALVALCAAFVVACSPAPAGVGTSPTTGASPVTGTSPTTTATPDACAKESLALTRPGRLTIGTDNPAYPPWFGGGTPRGSSWELNDPATGQGFESAVAYAVAEKLGFSRDEVTWIVVPFDNAFKPGPKDFDFDINQISYDRQRAQAVDFSDSYYNVNQAVVALRDNRVATARTRAELKPFKLGAPVGTTSYNYIVRNVQPNEQPAVFNTLNDGVSALRAKQIDGLVVDLPSAFFITAAQVPNSTIVGQFPTVGEQERFGMVLEKGSPLTPCVNRALAALKADGTLARIQREWLSDQANAPVLQ